MAGNRRWSGDSPWSGRPGPARPPRALLVDFWGTLVRQDSFDLGAGLEAAFTSPVGKPALRDQSHADWLATLTREIDRVHATNACDFSVTTFLRERVPEPTVSEIEWLLLDRSSVFHAMEGARDALAAVERIGLPMIVVSNTVFSAGTLRGILARHDLAAPFRHVISSADLGVRKPDPRIFRAAIETVGVGASDAWHVGDSWESDVLGAHAAGVFPVWLSEDARAGREVAHH